MREPDETGLVGISVSNGCEVTLTDAQGHYEISLARTETLFISQPAGYSVAVDENNTPRFY